jgi:putative spermidine/putrescine transport system ATP-binding protein
MSYLELSNLRVEYEKDQPILENFNLSVNEGELVSLLGPSGCGKTTTLRAVAGFIELTDGTISVDDEDISRLAPNKRDIGLVFQSYALFPHLTVAQNVGFGLRMRGVRGNEQDRRVADALALVDLEGLEERRPAQLSGGQRQRVAIARAIVIEPKLLLMDEPLSNLDAKLRVGMRTELRRLQQRLGTTMLYVTHDQVEALTLSDRIVVMNHGVIEQIGPPEEIYHQPATAFVADFMGFDNHFAARVTGVDSAQISLEVGQHPVVANAHRAAIVPDIDDAVSVYFRPGSPFLSTDAVDNSLPGSITFRTFHGSNVEYLVSTEAGEFTIYLDEQASAYDLGAIHLAFDPSRLVVMAGGHVAFSAG